MTSDPKFFVEGATRFDIQQGELGIDISYKTGIDFCHILINSKLINLISINLIPSIGR